MSNRTKPAMKKPPAPSRPSKTMMKMLEEQQRQEKEKQEEEVRRRQVPGEKLPADIIKLIASSGNLSIEDILNYCKAHPRYDKLICQNKRFWIDRAKQELPKSIQPGMLTVGQLENMLSDDRINPVDIQDFIRNLTRRLPFRKAFRYEDDEWKNITDEIIKAVEAGDYASFVAMVPLVLRNNIDPLWHIIMTAVETEQFDILDTIFRMNVWEFIRSRNPYYLYQLLVTALLHQHSLISELILGDFEPRFRKTAYVEQLRQLASFDPNLSQIIAEELEESDVDVDDEDMLKMISDALLRGEAPVINRESMAVVLHR